MTSPITAAWPDTPGAALGFPPPAASAERTAGGTSLGDLWSMLMRRRNIVFASAAVGLVLALLLSLLATPEYRASATLEIDEQTVQVIDLGGQDAIPVSDGKFLETQLALLRSRSLAERVARDLKLGDNPGFANPEAAPQARLDQATDALAANVVIEPVSDSRLVRVGYVSPDPGLAADVANSFARNFIESTLQRRYAANDYARAFLERRIGEVRKALEDSERKLVLYAQAQGIVSVGGGRGEGSEGLASESLQSASLSAANSELALAQNARVAAQQRYLQASRSGATTETLQSPSLQSMKTQLAQLRASYAQKRTELTPDHPEMRELQSGITALEREIGRERGTILTALRAEAAAASAREAELRERVGALTGNVLDLRGRTIQYNILQRDVDTNRQLYDALLQRFKEVGVSGGVGENRIAVVDPAKRPDQAFAPDIPRNVLIGTVLGLIAGVGLAIGTGLLLNKIKTPADIQDQIDIPALGSVPLERGLPIEEALVTPRSPLFEAYASLRSHILFATGQGGLRSLLVTSSASGEGKTTTSLALAQNFARMGKATLLVDADLRHPSFLSDAPSPGFAGVLAGEAALADAIVETDTAHLSLLPAGASPANPADLLANGGLAQTVAALHERFDFVIFDGPPVLGLADAPLLAAAVDRALIVFHADGVRVPAARNAVARLRAANATILGGVLTMFEGTGLGDAYGYEYGYGEDRKGKTVLRIATRPDAVHPPRAAAYTAERRAPASDTTGRVGHGPFRWFGTAARIAFAIAVMGAFGLATIWGGVDVGGASDITLHIAAFLVLTALAVAAFPRTPLWRIGAALAAFGAGIELVQMIPALGRQAAFSEWLADLVAIGCVLALVWAYRSVMPDRRG